MNVIIHCDQCSKKLSIPEASLGKKIRCPGCKAVFVAADEAAITTPAPPKVKSSGPPPLRSAHVDDDDDAPEPEERPRKKRQRDTLPFPPIKLRATVTSKNETIKKGNYAAELDEEGLILTRKKPGNLDIPVGTPTTYEGKNKITVEIDGEEITLQLARPRTYQNRMSETIAAFLNGEASEVFATDYEIPWYMFIFVVLPWGIPILTLGGGLPVLLGALISGGNYAVVSQESWSPGTRIAVAAALTILGYVSIVVLVIVVLKAQFFGRF